MVDLTIQSHPVGTGSNHYKYGHSDGLPKVVDFFTCSLSSLLYKVLINWLTVVIQMCYIIFRLTVVIRMEGQYVG